MPDNMEKRNYDLKESRADKEENKAIVEGHAAVFGQKADIGGYFYEVIERGAFPEESLRDVALFFNHDASRIPLARCRRDNADSTMTLTVDDVGLAIRARLDVENNPEARALYSSVVRGDLSKMSFAFRVDSEQWQDLESEKPTRIIKKFAELRDVSIVNFPAYDQTDIFARAKDTLDDAKKILEEKKMAEKDLRARITELEEKFAGMAKDNDRQHKEETPQPPEKRDGGNDAIRNQTQKYIPGKGFIPAEKRDNVNYNSQLEQREAAGKELKENRKVQSPLSTFGELRAVTVTPASGEAATILVPQTFSSTINPDFPVVSSLIDSVAHLSLNGGESFKQPYVTDIETGGYTTEGADATKAETKFAYAEINRTKITAYAEITEELQKLPNAAYADVVFQNIRTSMRKLLTKEILVGAGGTNQLVGIFSDKATAIDATTDLSISDITDTTLDEILFHYGGEEDVENPAVLILNKFDLLAFAKVRTSVKQKFYEITYNGNGGAINGVPFIINSACKQLTAVDGATGDYCMAYGHLNNYQLVEFSPMEVKRSDDYKFREGMTAFRGNCFFGGNVVKHNGFLRVVRK